MAFKGIWTTAYVKGDSLLVLDKHPVGGFSPIIENARNRFAGLIEKSGFTQVQGVLKALIIGDRSQISPETRQAFNRAGVGHLLAISGLHIGIVATVAFGFFRWLMTRFRSLLWRAWTRKGAALLSLLPIYAYGMIAGFTPSTQRAVVMVSVFLLTFLFEREQDPLNTLSMAAFERIPEIGMMRAVGARKSFVSNMFLYETGLLSFAFVVLGFVSGYITVQILNVADITTTSEMLQ